MLSRNLAAVCLVVASSPAFAKLTVSKNVEAYGGDSGPQVIVVPLVQKGAKQALVELRGFGGKGSSQVILCNVRSSDGRDELVPESSSAAVPALSIAKGDDGKELSAGDQNLSANKALAQKVKGLEVAKRYTAQKKDEQAAATPAKDGAAKDANLTTSFAYRASVDHSDNGLEVAKGEDKESQSELSDALYLLFEHTAANGAVFRVGLDLSSKNGATDDTSDIVDTAMGEINLGQYVQVGVGRMPLHLGGFEGKLADQKPEEQSAYSVYYENRMPLVDVNGKNSAAAIELAALMGAGGRLSLQLTNDVAPVDSDKDGQADWSYVSDRRMQPAAIIEWSASYGPFSPLLQVASYDANHSLYTGVGARVVLAGVEANVDYVMDQRAAKTANEVKKTSYANTVVDLRYRNAYVSPFVKYAKFAATQPDLDFKGNDPVKLDDDNGQLVSGGFDFSLLGPYVIPHIAYTQRTIEVLTNARDPYQTEARSASVISVGVHGSF